MGKASRMCLRVNDKWQVELKVTETERVKPGSAMSRESHIEEYRAKVLRDWFRVRVGSLNLEYTISRGWARLSANAQK